MGARVGILGFGGFGLVGFWIGVLLSGVLRFWILDWGLGFRFQGFWGLGFVVQGFRFWWGCRIPLRLGIYA